MISADHKRCSTRPSVDRPNYDLAKVFFVALRGQKEVAVAVAVLRGPPCPPWTNVLPLQFFVVLRGQKKLQSPLQFSAALRVLRGQMCCRCSSSWPFVDKRKLQSPLQFSAALRVLRGQMCCRCNSSWPFVDKRKLQSPLQFSAALRVLRGQMCCRCSSSFCPRRATKNCNGSTFVHGGHGGPRRTATATATSFCPRRATKNCNGSTFVHGGHGGPRRTATATATSFCPRRATKGHEELQRQHICPRRKRRAAENCNGDCNFLLSTKGHEGPRRTATATHLSTEDTEGREELQRRLQLPFVHEGPRRTATATHLSTEDTEGRGELQRRLQLLLPTKDHEELQRQHICPRRTVLPLQFFVVLRGQKEVAVAVAVLRGPPCPPWTNVLPLQFFVVLPGPSWSFVGKRFPPTRPSRTDQIMTLHISVQTNVSEPWLPRRYAAFHYPLSPTPYPLAFLPLRLACDPASPLEDRGRFLRRTRGCSTVQPVWAVIHLVRVTRQIPPPRTT